MVAMAGGGNNFSSLLGSRELLVKTMVYHFQQRMARLSILTECLRLEQDPEAIQREAIVKFLDSLDGTFIQNSNAERGIFKSLVIVACQPDPKPTREAVEPSKVLNFQWDYTSGIAAPMGGGRPGTSTSIKETTFPSFATSLVAEHIEQQVRERTQAMEGILALLYERIDGGIGRADYCLLLTAFFDNPAYKNDVQRHPLSASTVAWNSFEKSVTSNSRSSQQEETRWNEISGLICAECTALWRVFEPPEGDESQHPLLEGLETEQGKSEVESLIFVLAQFVEKGSPHAAWMSNEQRPQALAVISFGLLLCLAGGESHSNSNILLLGDRTPRDYGTELVQLASNDGAAFDYLNTVLTNLTAAELATKPSTVVPDSLFDWQFSNDKNDVPLLENGAPSVDNDENKDMSRKVSAAVVLYTSIAREIVAASITAFSDTVLVIDAPDSCHNIGMLCKLVSSIYMNNDLLCEQYWDSWEEYLATRNRPEHHERNKFPICRLFDTSYKLALAAYGALANNQVKPDFFVSAMAPFFRLLSGLCYNSQIVDSVVKMTQKELLYAAISHCCNSRASDLVGSEEVLQHRAAILKSFENLAQAATASSSCLELLRTCLEHNSSLPAGPRLLFRIILGNDDPQIVCPVLGIVGHLMGGAPEDWIVCVAEEFLAPSGGDPASSKLIPYISSNYEELSYSAALVLAQLISHINVVSSSEALQAHQVVAFLQHLGAALLSGLTSLAFSASSNASSRMNPASFGASLENAEMILQSCANFLKWIRPLTSSGQDEIRTGAMLVRDSLISALANSDLGMVVIYYAVIPVSFRAALKMEETLRDQSIVEHVANEGDTQKYGAWASLSLGKKTNPSGAGLARKNVLDFVSKMTPGDFDFMALRARGWVRSASNDGESAMTTAWAALRLLSEWASHVEEIAKTHVDDLKSSVLPLSGDEATLVRDLSPQRLLCMQAPAPVPCQLNSSLTALWQNLGLSTFELLLPYLRSDDEEATDQIIDKTLPVSVVLDFLDACIVHTISVSPKDWSAEASLLTAVSQSNGFASILKDFVREGIDLVKSQDDATKFTETEKTRVLLMLRSLRIISACVGSSLASANMMVDDDMINLLVTASLSVGDVIDRNRPEEVTAMHVLKMRVAASSLDALSSFWKRSRSGVPTDSNEALTKRADSQSAFIDKLLQIVSDV